MQDSTRPEAVADEREACQQRPTSGRPRQTHASSSYCIIRSNKLRRTSAQPAQDEHRPAPTTAANHDRHHAMACDGRPAEAAAVAAGRQQQQPSRRRRPGPPTGSLNETPGRRHGPPLATGSGQQVSHSTKAAQHQPRRGQIVSSSSSPSSSPPPPPPLPPQASPSPSSRPGNRNERIADAKEAPARLPVDGQRRRPPAGWCRAAGAEQALPTAANRISSVLIVLVACWAAWPLATVAGQQYRPEWPQKVIEQEIFLLNLEDGYFGCQVNASQDFLQLFELSRLCDGQTQCYLGSDELESQLKCRDRERCESPSPPSGNGSSGASEEHVRCVNGVCLDGLCYCNDGFGGRSCDIPDENECKFRPCDVFAHCTNTMGSYYCSCFPGKCPALRDSWPAAAMSRRRPPSQISQVT
jgi:hypothetical protein